MVHDGAIRNPFTSYRWHMCTGFNCPLHQMARPNPSADSASLWAVVWAEAAWGCSSFCPWESPRPWFSTGRFDTTLRNDVLKNKALNHWPTFWWAYCFQHLPLPPRCESNALASRKSSFRDCTQLSQIHLLIKTSGFSISNEPEIGIILVPVTSSAHIKAPPAIQL